MKKQRLNEINQELKVYLEQINAHPLYNEIKTLDNLQFFVREHIFAVWDFMCLLKALYSRLVCNTNLWYPSVDAYSVNLRLNGQNRHGKIELIA